MVKTLMVLLYCLSIDLSAKELIFNTQDFKPFSYELNGKPAGVGVEIVEKVCKQADIAYKINFLPWTRAQYEVNNGYAQGLFILAKTEEREQKLIFSIPLIESEYGFFVPVNDNFDYKTVKDFNNKIIGVYGPSGTSESLHKLAIEAENIKDIDMTVDDISAFRKLEIKRIDAVYSNKDVGEMLIKDLGLNKIKYGFLHKKIIYHIAFSKQNNNAESVNKFLETLKNFKKRGDLKKILTRYHINEAK